MNQIESGSEAVRTSAGRVPNAVRPALSGCPECGAVRMIAAPAVGTCESCGSTLSVIEPDRVPSQAGATQTVAICALATAWG